MNWGDWSKLASNFQGGNKSLEKMGVALDEIAQIVWKKIHLHHSQRDNIKDRGATCFPTSVAMVAHSMYVDNVQHFTTKQSRFLHDKHLDDTLILDVEKNFQIYQTKTAQVAGRWARNMHPRKVAAFWQWYFEQKIGGFKISIHGKNVKKMRTALDERKFLISNTRLTRAGHIVVVNGYSKKTGEFIYNDPWGKYPYKTAAEKGLKAGIDVYCKPALMKSWFMIFDYA